jgi:hypothetical protein
VTSTAPSSNARRTRRERLYWLLGAALLVVAGVGILVLRPSPDPTQHVITSSTTTTTTGGAPVLQGLARSIPRELLVPSLGIAVPVGQLGLQANHQVQVPTSAHTVGWFRLGPTPGQVGSSVILGHVDSYRGPGIFFTLKSLAVGALIEVRLSDGLTAQFRVTSVVQYAKSTFPDRLVYGSSSNRWLNLVTCGGTFDHATGSYESNIVAFSRLVGTVASTS